MNLRVQMDVAEFLDTLVDRLDRALVEATQQQVSHARPGRGAMRIALLTPAPREQPSAIVRNFAGVLCNQLVCDGCPHKFETDEVHSPPPLPSAAPPERLRIHCSRSA